jgi:hypothetical protein
VGRNLPPELLEEDVDVKRSLRIKEEDLFEKEI